MRYQQIKGIILKKRPFIENDYILTIYSAELGKIEALAKGARKISSKFSGNLETLNICNFQLYKSPKNFIITQCQLQKTFNELRKNLEDSVLAMLLIEIFQKSIHGKEAGQELLSLIEETLDQLNRSTQKKLLIESFKLKLLKNLGVLPDTHNCSSCGKDWDKLINIWLDQEGNLNCENCKNISCKHQINFNMMKLMNFLIHRPSENKQKIILKKDEENRLKEISNFFLHKYINKEIFSEKIIAATLS